MTTREEIEKLIPRLREHVCTCGGMCGQKVPAYIGEAADALHRLLAEAGSGEIGLKTEEGLTSSDLDWLIDVVRADVSEPTAKVEERTAIAVLRDPSLSHASVWAAVPQEARLQVAGIIEQLVIDRARLLSSRAAEWQGIASAPKDGTLVFLLSARYESPNPWPTEGEPLVFVHEPRCALGQWDSEGTSWVDENGLLGGDTYTLAVTGIWSSGGGWFQPNEITHWAPLPALIPPPAEENREGG